MYVSCNKRCIIHNNRLLRPNSSIVPISITGSVGRLLVVDEPEWFLVGTSEWGLVKSYASIFQGSHHQGKSGKVREYVWQLVPPSGTTKPKSGHGLIECRTCNLKPIDELLWLLWNNSHYEATQYFDPHLCFHAAIKPSWHKNAWVFTHLLLWTFSSAFAPKFVMRRYVTSYCDVTWRHDVLLWCHMSHHRSYHSHLPIVIAT